jgi:hypothetical protein
MKRICILGLLALFCIVGPIALFIASGLIFDMGHHVGLAIAMCLLSIGWAIPGFTVGGTALVAMIPGDEADGAK